MFENIQGMIGGSAAVHKCSRRMDEVSKNRMKLKSDAEVVLVGIRVVAIVFRGDLLLDEAWKPGAYKRQAKAKHR